MANETDARKDAKLPVGNREGLREMCATWRSSLKAMRDETLERLQGPILATPVVRPKAGDDTLASRLGRDLVAFRAKRSSDEALDSFRRRLNRLDDLLATVDLFPLFPAIGTVMAFRDSAIEHCGRIGTPAPTKGTVGVVTGYDLTSEFHIFVTLPLSTVSTHGDRIVSHPEDPVTYAMSVEMLDVVEVGMLVGSGPNMQPGYLATHERTDEEGTEMLVEARGFVWRIRMEGGVPVNVGRCASEDDCDWLVRIGEGTPAPRA